MGVPPGGFRSAPRSPGGPGATALQAGVPGTGYPPHLGPGVTVHRPPSRLAHALARFWAERERPVPSSVLVNSGIVGVAGGGLLVGHRLGLGAAAVGLALWAAAVPAFVRRRAWLDLVTVALAVLLVAMVAVRDAGWVVALCLLAAAMLSTVAATSARGGPAVLASGASWAAGVVRTLPWLVRGAGTLAGHRRGQVLVAARSLAVTAGLLLVFGVLFTSADAVFASYVPRLELELLPGQVVVGLLVAVASATLAHLALAPPPWSGVRLPLGRPARLGEWLLPLVALDALVLAFVLVQLGGVLGGHRHVLGTAGLSYAEYARQGFAQLVAVTALTLVVVAVAARRAPRGTGRERLISRLVLGVLCVGTLGVVASALRRMDLYVEAFGLTRLRLFVVMAEVVLGVVLLLLLAAGVRWRAGWLPRAVVHVAGAGVLALALVNPDALIARHNLTADLEVPVDTVYLAGLSADAVPALHALDDPLWACLVHGGTDGGAAAWNLGRARASELAGSAPGGSTCADAYAKR